MFTIDGNYIPKKKIMENFEDISLPKEITIKMEDDEIGDQSSTISLSCSNLNQLSSNCAWYETMAQLSSTDNVLNTQITALENTITTKNETILSLENQLEQNDITPVTKVTDEVDFGLNYTTFSFTSEDGIIRHGVKIRGTFKHPDESIDSVTIDIKYKNVNTEGSHILLGSFTTTHNSIFSDDGENVPGFDVEDEFGNLIYSDAALLRMPQDSSFLNQINISISGDTVRFQNINKI